MSTESSTASASASLPTRKSLASFFIVRPVFAIVLAIVTSLAGVFGIFNLPISQYPDIAPTTINISASYTGASAEAVQNSVTTVIEDAMTGFADLLYMESTSSSGSASISLTFGTGVDADIAQVQVQNKVSQVESQLPDAVRDAGLTVDRSAGSILMVGNIVSTETPIRPWSCPTSWLPPSNRPSGRSMAWATSCPSVRAMPCASGSIPWRWRSTS